MSEPEWITDAVSCYAEGAEGDLLECALNDLTAATSGEPLFGVLVGGAVIFSMYLAGNGHPAPPTVVTILLGSIMVPLLPGSYTQIAYTIVVLGLAFGVISIGGRYVLE